METINIYVGNSTSGNKVYEEVLVLPIGNDKFRVAASPGLVLGLAKDDEIIYNKENCDFFLIKRGENVCIQLYVKPTMREQVDVLIKEVITCLDGTLDGRTEKLVVFSISISKGFEKIEKVFNSFVERNKQAEWYYGNIYDEKDGVTPLNWWLST